MPRRGRPPHPDILTPREWDVLALLRDGRSNDEIAARLGISLSTAKFHVSEILGKLGLGSREEAARWQPERVASRGVLMQPFAALRRVHPGGPLQLAGAALILAVAAGVGALAWGLVAARRPAASPGNAAWSVDDAAASAQPSVILFDTANRHVRRLPMEDSVSGARWVKPGQTWVAQLHANTPEVAYEVYDLDGDRTWTVPPDLTRAIVPAPGGDAVLIERTDNQYLVASIPEGKGGTFLSGARDLAFSPDGSRVAYTTLGGGDKDNINHDWRTIYLAAKNSLTGFVGAGMAVQSQREADGVIDLAPDPWSPDGAYLLVERFSPCPNASPDPGNCYGIPTFEVYGTQETAQRVWGAYSGILQSVAWAGPGRLLVTFYRDAEGDPAYPAARRLLVPLGGAVSPVPSVIDYAWYVSVSPDGRYAVARVGADAGERCALFDVSSGWKELVALHPAGGDTADSDFCDSATWSAGDDEVLVSAGSPP